MPAIDFSRVLQILKDFTPSTPFWQKNRGDIFIYGTGTMGRDICQILLNRGLIVRGFLDHLSQHNSFCDLPLLKPDDVSLSPELRSQIVVVLGIHNPFADIAKIVERLKSLGYQNFVNLIEMFDYLGPEFGNRYWLVPRRFYDGLEPVLTRAYHLWADETSRQIYTRILLYRLTGDHEFLPEPDWDHQYMAQDVPGWKTPLRLIDCGAFDGDSIRDFRKAGMEFEAIAAFEPDLANFHQLSTFLGENHALCSDITAWPCGVYSATTQMHFDATSNVSSVLSKTGKLTVQCVAIDDALPGFAPNLIKMDIEGAEYDALLGAQKTIACHLPGLAISLYHRPEHLWQIPFLVERLAATGNSRYDYYLRSHRNDGYELVLYAIPVKHF